MKIVNRTKVEQVFGGITLKPGETYPHPLDHDGDGKKGGSLPAENREPKKRGRPPKKK